LDAIVQRIVATAASIYSPSLIPVINATGVIIHTNLGRAPLSASAMAAVEAVATGYANLEFDLEKGERGSRYTHVVRLLTHLAGTTAALVVNNNAAAVLLALSALAKGKEVIVSRGQAVEIGGGFRIPDIIRQSGCKLVEVGTTNRTNTNDYEQAISPRTAAVLRVHSSNFRIIGFTESVPLADLCRLAHARGLVVIDDLGSGSLLDTAAYGLAHEPMVQESVAAGADVVTFSGDKLLGGPQAGIIVGQASFIDRMRRHPLARALRVDKMTIAALQATLLHYAREEVTTHIPIWMMITRPLADIERTAQAWASALSPWATVMEGESTVGGGALPGEVLPTFVVAISLPEKSKGGEAAVQRLARSLRLGTPPIITRVERNALLLDPRTVLPGQEQVLLQRVRALLDTV